MISFLESQWIWMVLAILLLQTHSKVGHNNILNITDIADIYTLRKLKATCEYWIDGYRRGWTMMESEREREGGRERREGSKDWGICISVLIIWLCPIVIISYPSLLCSVSQVCTHIYKIHLAPQKFHKHDSNISVAYCRSERKIQVQVASVTQWRAGGMWV